LNSQFFDQARKSHNIILECLIQQDTMAAEIAICNDILDVGKYMSEETNSDVFYPRSLKNNSFETLIGKKHQSRIVWDNDPILKKDNRFIKRVGSSNLFIVFAED
jgi:hypothetical protein